MDVGGRERLLRSDTPFDREEDGGQTHPKHTDVTPADDVDDEDAKDASGNGDSGDDHRVGECLGIETDRFEECGAVQVDELLDPESSAGSNCRGRTYVSTALVGKEAHHADLCPLSATTR